VYPSPEITTGSHPATYSHWEFPILSVNSDQHADHHHNSGANAMTETPSQLDSSSLTHLIPSANQSILNDFAMDALNFPGMQASITGEDEATVNALNVQTGWPQTQDYDTSSFSTNSFDSAAAGIYFDRTLGSYANEFQY
jgi:hypothetical protein